MARPLHPGCAVVVVPPAVPPAGKASSHVGLPSALPLDAVAALLRAAAVYADPSVPADVASACGAAAVPGPEELVERARSEPVVLLTTAGDGGLPASGGDGGLPGSSGGDGGLPGSSGGDGGLSGSSGGDGGLSGSSGGDGGLPGPGGDGGLPGSSGGDGGLPGSGSDGGLPASGGDGGLPGSSGGDGGLPGAPVIGSARPLGAGLVAAAAVMDRLRSPGGCPWDAEQTHESLRKFLIEETYELLDAIDSGDREAFREELGDVLLQVLFHARIAAEDTSAPFDIDDVAAELATKLIRRHPHVFDDDDTVHDASSQELRWEQLKAVEKNRTSIVDGVALGQPALSLVAALARRAARAGVHLPEQAGADGVGEQLFAIAVQAAVSGEDPELALRHVARQFASNLRAAPPPTP